MVSKSALLHAARAVQRSDDYLGPAAVRAVAERHVEVVLRDGHAVSAELALAVPYRPALGDSMLVTGRGGEYYVIGVLRGRGRTELHLDGDVELRAVGGSLELSADRGVRIRGREIEVTAAKLTTLVGAAVEHFTTLAQRVTALASLHAGRKHTVVDGESLETSKRTTLLCEETVTINGSQVHLG
jgi:hypothetical protein